MRVWVALLLAGCLHDELVVCDGGIACPVGTTCAPPGSIAPCVSTSCGDGVIGLAEDCDGEKLGGSTCLALGYHADALACDPITCRYDFSGCNGRCGDGQVSGPEDCDGDAVIDVGCTQLVGFRFDYGRPQCTPQCTYDASTCGYYGFERLYESAVELEQFCGIGDATSTTIVFAENDQLYQIPDLIGATPAPLFEPLGRPIDRVACTSTSMAVLSNGELFVHESAAWSQVEDFGDHANDVAAGADGFAVALGNANGQGSILVGNASGWTRILTDHPMRTAWGSPSHYIAAGDGGTVVDTGTTTTHDPQTIDGIAGEPHWSWSAPSGSYYLATKAPPDNVLYHRTMTGDFVSVKNLAGVTRDTGPIGGTGSSNVFVASHLLQTFDGNTWWDSVDEHGSFSRIWLDARGRIYATLGPELLRSRSLWFSIPAPTEAIEVESDGEIWVISQGVLYRNNSPRPSLPEPIAFDVATPAYFVVGTSSAARVGASVESIAVTGLRDVIALDATHAVAVGNGVVARYDGTWTTSTIDADLRSIVQLPSGELVAVGSVVASWSAGTLTSESIAGEVLESAVVVGDDIWAVGAHGLIAHRTADRQWHVVPSPTTHDLERVRAFPNGTLVAVGDRTMLLQDGFGWLPIRPPVTGANFVALAVLAERIYVGTTVATYMLYGPSVK